MTESQASTTAPAARSAADHVFSEKAVSCPSNGLITLFLVPSNYLKCYMIFKI
jgi:hypothetical protein